MRQAAPVCVFWLRACFSNSYLLRSIEGIGVSLYQVFGTVFQFFFYRYVAPTAQHRFQLSAFPFIVLSDFHSSQPTATAICCVPTARQTNSSIFLQTFCTYGASSTDIFSTDILHLRRKFYQYVAPAAQRFTFRLSPFTFFLTF
jgi:hypothetical protein